MINMTEYQTKMLGQQETIIELLNKLIVVCAAVAISDPGNSVPIYSMTRAANFAQRIFEEDR